eukprot:sb/3473516/
MFVKYFIGQVLEGMRQSEIEIEKTDHLDYTFVLPGGLTDGPVTGIHYTAQRAGACGADKYIEPPNSNMLIACSRPIPNSNLSPLSPKQGLTLPLPLEKSFITNDTDFYVSQVDRSGATRTDRADVARFILSILEDEDSYRKIRAICPVDN